MSVSKAFWDRIIKGILFLIAFALGFGAAWFFIKALP